jgi:hypothetical protein
MLSEVGNAGDNATAPLMHNGFSLVCQHLSRETESLLIPLGKASGYFEAF